MAGRSVSYRMKDEEVLVQGLGSLSHDGNSFIAPAEIVGPASVTALQKAIGKHLDNYRHDQEQLLVSPTPAKHFDEDYAVVEATSFLISSDEILLRTSMYFGTSLEETELERLASSFLKRLGCDVREFDVEGGGYDAAWSVTFAAPTRGRMVSDLLAIGKQLENLLNALGPEGQLTSESVKELARSGSLQVLVGQAENSWLEVKSQGYRLDQEAQKIELAQDVARFANAEEGGLLLVGLRTKKVGEQDVIRGLKPVPLDHIKPLRYRNTVDRRIYPPVEGLRVEVCGASSGSGYLLIDVPAQPEELKPFLVHGAIAAGRAEGAFISIVRRRGEDSIPISAASIHSMLAAGRALFRGKQ